MERHINTYGGMNKDVAYDSIPSNLYIHAEGIRITTHKGESMGAFTNIKGNKESFTIPQLSPSKNAEIIGYATARNRIYLLVGDDSGINSWIYEVRYDEATREIIPGYNPKLIYNANLKLKKGFPIKAICRYESENIIRLYWTDYDNYLRSLNVADPDVLTFPAGQIDIFPDVKYVQSYLTSVLGGGSLLSGEYQPAYRLLTKDGKETLISPPGNLIHVVASSETLSQSAQYNGDTSNVNTNKSLSITIDVSNYTDFETIELIMIYHSALLGAPVIKSVEKKSIVGTSVNFIYTGTEDSITTIELDTYTAKTNPFKTCKTLAQKDNALVIANLKSAAVAVSDLLGDGETFSASTLRYKSDGITTPPSGAFNSEYNRDAHWNDSWHSDDQYKFNSSGTRLGGEGPNISYTFHLEPFTLDGTNAPAFANVAPIPFGFGHDVHDLKDGPVYDKNTTFPNMASPFISGLLRGYKRGETYRFGIVFYTKKGESTFVEHIGDIKFPDISDIDSVVNLSGYKYFPTSKASGGNTFGYAMGIQFNLDFASCPNFLNEIESYQIVRVKREIEDTRRACSGIIKNYWTAPVGGQESAYDLQINGSQLVLHMFPYNPSQGGTFNGTFVNLNTEYAAFDGTNVYETKGEAVNFYSPEVSYNFNNVRGRGTALTGTPSLLMTGAYRTYSKTLEGSEQDLNTTYGIGEKCSDFRGTLRDVNPVTFGTKENIRKWDSVKSSVMDHTVNYQNSNAVTGLIEGFASTVLTPQTTFYLRNYYAIDDYTESASTLNKPQPASGQQSIPEFFKGGTCLMGKVGTFGTTDPLDGTTITESAEDYFQTSAQGGALGVLDHTSLAIDTGLYSTSTPIMDLVLPKIEVYGGYTPDALEANIFIPASPVISKDKIDPIVYGGDIFLNMFTLQLSTLDFLNPELYANPNQDFVREQSETQIMVTESLINVDLANGSTLKTGVSFNFNGTDLEILRQETGNTNDAVTSYGKSNSMYNYFSVYSKENEDIIFITKKANAVPGAEINDIRARISNTKVNNEDIDSWTQFPENDYWDVDDYGPINEILNWRDSVFFFQDRAYGTYAINREAVTTTNDGVPTSLGTGKGFSSHRYNSQEVGSIHQWGIKATDKGIYFFDALHRKIQMVSDGAGDLSEIKGMHSWINQLPQGVFFRKENGGDNPIMNNGIAIGKTLIDDEVVFTFISGDERYSLVYDELAQQFCGFDPAKPSLFIENGDIILSANPANRSKIYTHGLGNWGEFYGNIEECSISLVINANADINKILRTFEFNTIVRDNNKVIDRTQTITAFRIQTEYQDTGKVLFSSGRIKRRFDKWRVKIPRNSLSSKKDRLRSTHFILTLYFDNTYNKELIMNRLMSYYDPQIF